MENNILSQLLSQLNKFKDNRSNLNQTIEELKGSKDLTHNSITELQQKHKNILFEITKSTQQLESLDATISKLQEGYNNIIESGEFLITLIENHTDQQ